jgi:hypothetical protein
LQPGPPFARATAADTTREEPVDTSSSIIRPGILVTIATLCASALAAGACGGYQTVREAETPAESRLAWPVERCEIMKEPASLPSVYRLADSVRLGAALDSVQGPLSFGVSVSSRGDVETVSVLHVAELAPEVRRAWEDRLIAVLLKQDPAPLPYTVRLSRDEAGAWRVDRSVYCAPRVAQSPGFTRFLGTPRPRGTSSVEVRVSVTETGFGESVHLPYPPGNRDVDANIRQQAMALRFLPAMLNGQPVPSTFTYYVTLRTRSGFRR